MMAGELTTSIPTHYDRLAIFDCDGVLAHKKGSWDTIHQKFGTVDHQQDHFEKYRNGELDMVKWSELTVEHWQGRPAEQLEAAVTEVTPVSGFQETIDSLKDLEFAIGVVSAGVLQYVEQIIGEASMDFIISNSIETADGELTGEVQVNVTDQNKIDWFQKLVDYSEVPEGNVVLIGDAENDLMKIHPGNLSIAFNPRDGRARNVADTVITDGNLQLILDPIREWLEQTASPTSRTFN